MDRSHLMNTYNPMQVDIEKGERCWLVDRDGERYLDAIAGIAVCGLGHSHPELNDALTQQAQQLWHISNMFHIDSQAALADKLCALSGMDNVFFSNSGAEANETAIKIARKFGHTKNIDTPTIIVLEHSFHGRTLATLTATGSRKVQVGFEPLVHGFVRTPTNDLDAIKAIAQNNKNVVAIMLEPIQGEGGVRPLDEDYLTALRALCDDHDWLLMFDEIQTGNGRTGQFFAYQHLGITPDVVTTAKGLGNGFPIGACLAKGKAADVLGPGNHGSTFGGNPLACAVGLKVIEIIERDNLLERATHIGETIRAQLTEQLVDTKGVVEIRGRGLMIGIELDRNCDGAKQKALEHGLIFNVTQGNTIRLLPMLIMTDDEVKDLIERTVATVKAELARAK